MIEKVQRDWWWYMEKMGQLKYKLKKKKKTFNWNWTKICKEFIVNAPNA